MTKEIAKTETALTVLEANNFNLVPLSGEIADIIDDEMEGLGTITFDTVKIPSGGGRAFEVPGEDEDNPEMLAELTGIILHHHPVNAYWIDSYTGGNQQPDCASYDGKTGTMAESGECRDCAECPFNQFGSAGEGKACKNMHRLYLLRSGEPLPVILALPPTSLKALKNYLCKRVVVKGKRSWQVLTKITLKKEVSSGGIAYSSAVFSKVADLSPSESAAVEPIVKAVKALITSVDITDDAHGGYAASAEGFTEMSPEDDLPFNA